MTAKILGWQILKRLQAMATVGFPPELRHSSLLLALPAELRNSIYRFILLQPSDIPHALFFLDNTSPDTSSNARWPHICTKILRTCKQINAEATPILYGENIFLAHSALLATLPSLLLATQPHRVVSSPVLQPRVTTMIRRFHIQVRLDVDPRFDAAKLEASFTGAEELVVEVFQAMFESCDFTVLKLFEGVRGVGKAKVFGSVGDGKYASWLGQNMMSPPGTQATGSGEKTTDSAIAWNFWTLGNR